jgi:hypothetical protein
VAAAVVRLDPYGAAECVWGERLDDDHMQLTTVPHPASGRRWGDVVRHATEPRGDRGGYPVFDEIERTWESDVPTVRVLLLASPRNLDELYRLVASKGWAVVNWTTSIELRCPVCSWGDPSGVHRHPTTRPDARQDIGIAGPPPAVDAAVRDWERWRNDREVLLIEVVA